MGEMQHVMIAMYHILVLLPNNLFKGMDGMKHVAYFVTKSERQAIMAEEASAEVIMDNCIRCHKDLNTRVVRTGK